jgi:cyclophilin family peptidyl-prolyl cis-trans isomerase
MNIYDLSFTSQRLEATIPPRGGIHHSDTFELHGEYRRTCLTVHLQKMHISCLCACAFSIEFAYKYYGQWHYVKIDEPNQNHEQLLVLAGSDKMPSGEPRGIRVRCEVSIESKSKLGFFDILVMPYWSPRGAVRFLELVRDGYYDGVAMHRVVPNFLTQFGIARNYELRSSVRDIMIWDDFNLNTPFKPGTVSFAGSGPDSRTSEVFIVMPGASEAQLEALGNHPWETPFGFVEGDIENGYLSKIYSGYGDMVRMLSFAFMLWTTPNTESFP